MQEKAGIKIKAWIEEGIQVPLVETAEKQFFLFFPIFFLCLMDTFYLDVLDVKIMSLS